MKTSLIQASGREAFGRLVVCVLMALLVGAAVSPCRSIVDMEMSAGVQQLIRQAEEEGQLVETVRFRVRKANSSEWRSSVVAVVDVNGVENDADHPLLRELTAMGVDYHNYVFSQLLRKKEPLWARGVSIGLLYGLAPALGGAAAGVFGTIAGSWCAVPIGVIGIIGALWTIVNTAGDLSDKDSADSSRSAGCKVVSRFQASVNEGTRESFAGLVLVDRRWGKSSSREFRNALSQYLGEDSSTQVIFE